MLDRALILVVGRSSGGGIVDIFTTTRVLVEELYPENDRVGRKH